VLAVLGHGIEIIPRAIVKSLRSIIRHYGRSSDIILIDVILSCHNKHTNEYNRDLPQQYTSTAPKISTEACESTMLQNKYKKTLQISLARKFKALVKVAFGKWRCGHSKSAARALQWKRRSSVSPLSHAQKRHSMGWAKGSMKHEDVCRGSVPNRLLEVYCFWVSNKKTLNYEHQPVAGWWLYFKLKPIAVFWMVEAERSADDAMPK